MKFARHFSGIQKTVTIVVFSFLVLGMLGHAQTHRLRPRKIGDQLTSTTPNAAPQLPCTPQLQNKHGQAVNVDVRVISTPAKDFYDRASIWINLGLAVVGLIGVVIAICTLRKIERQIGVARADTDAMVRAERAWVVVNVDSPASGHFNFIATNVGRTPAKVHSIWSTHIITERGEQLSVPCDEKTGESLLNTPHCLIPPTATEIVFRFNITDLDRTPQGVGWRVTNGLAELRFYGRIVYSDILQPDIATQHETKWLYWCVPIEGSLPFPDSQHPKHNTYT